MLSTLETKPDWVLKLGLQCISFVTLDKLWKNNSNDNNESSLNCVYTACLIERNCKVKKIQREK